MTVHDIALDLIDVGDNPRRDPQGLDELADSIRQQGVIAPVMVRTDGERFRLVYGQRRLLASRIAGRATIPAIVTGDEPNLDLAKSIVENIQRENLNAIDEARALESMLAAGATQHDVGRLLGRSASWVSNRLRVLHGDPYVVEAVQSGLLPVQHAVVIVGLPARQQRQVAKRAVVEQWSFHKLERLLAPQRTSAAPRGEKRSPEIASETPEAASRYAASLGRLTAKVNPELARLLLWSLVEMDVFIQGRFEHRHPLGITGDGRTWRIIADLTPASLARELAQVCGEFIAEYGPTAVRAAIPAAAA